MNTYNLLVITKQLLDLGDAQAQQSTALVTALASSGANVDVITGARPISDHPLFAKDGIRVHAIPARWLPRGQSVATKVGRKLQRNLSACFATRWVREGASVANELMGRRQYDAIISIAMPIESHLVAKSAQRKAPWIACFSDPWPESILPEPYSDFALPFVDFMHRKVVASILHDATSLVFTCAQSRDCFTAAYPEFSIEKTCVIPHVHVGEYIPSSGTEGNTDVKLVHAGALSRERVCHELADAMAMLPEQSRLHLEFVGEVHPAMIRALDRAGAMTRVSINPWRPKREVMEIASSAQALLLVEAEMSFYPFLPSKLADYSSTGKPILAITGSNSPSAQLIKSNHAGIVTSHDTASILRGLLAIEAGYSRLSSRCLHSAFEASHVIDAYTRLVQSLRI